MKKVLTTLFTLTLLIVSSACFADTLDIINTLTREYGKVTLTHDVSDEKLRKFTFNANYNEIQKSFDILILNNWCIKGATVYGINEKIASLTITAAFNTNEKQDDLKMDLFIETVTDRHIPWTRSEEAIKAEEKKRSIFTSKKIRNELAVVSISTDFGDSVIIKGNTYQSQAVFKELFITLNNIPSISAPFFERGTYYDVEDGRKMDYTIRCRWGQKAVKPAPEK